MLQVLTIPWSTFDTRPFFFKACRHKWFLFHFHSNLLIHFFFESLRLLIFLKIFIWESSWFDISLMSGWFGNTDSIEFFQKRSGCLRNIFSISHSTLWSQWNQIAKLVVKWLWSNRWNSSVTFAFGVCQFRDVTTWTRFFGIFVCFFSVNILRFIPVSRAVGCSQCVAHTWSNHFGIELELEVLHLFLKWLNKFSLIIGDAISILSVLRTELQLWQLSLHLNLIHLGHNCSSYFFTFFFNITYHLILGFDQLLFQILDHMSIFLR